MSGRPSRPSLLVRRHTGGMGSRRVSNVATATTFRVPILRCAIVAGAGFEREMDILATTILPEVTQLARAHGIDAQFDLCALGVGPGAMADPYYWDDCTWLVRHHHNAAPASLNLLLLSNERYGAIIPPATVAQTLFEIVVAESTNAALLKEWYILDPLTQQYRLHRPQSRFPKFPADKRQAEQWAAIATKLVTAFTSALTTANISADERHRFDCSGLHRFAHDSALHVPEGKAAPKLKWISRLIECESEPSAKQQAAVPTWFDASGQVDDPLRRARQLDYELDQGTLAADKTRFHVELSGEDAAQDAAAIEDYLGDWCAHVTSLLTDAIENIAADKESIALAGQLESLFYSRMPLHYQDHQGFGEMLGRLETFMTFSRETAESIADQILIVHGSEGTGKTSLVARAQLALETAGRGAVQVVRSAGQGFPAPVHTLRSLLRSLNAEIAAGFRREAAGITANLENDIADQERVIRELEMQVEAEGGDDEAQVDPAEYERLALLKLEKRQVTCVHDSLQDLTRELYERMSLASIRRPLLIILDGLDQVDNQPLVSQLKWLPAELPDYVKLVITCRPGELFNELRGQFMHPGCYLEVPDTLSTELAQDQYTSLLAFHGLASPDETTAKNLHNLARRLASPAAYPLLVHLARTTTWLNEAAWWKANSKATLVDIAVLILEMLEARCGKHLAAYTMVMLQTQPQLPGMTITDLCEQLTMQDRVLEEQASLQAGCAGVAAVPVMSLHRFIRLAGPLLLHSGLPSQYRLAHSFVAQAVRQRYNVDAQMAEHVVLGRARWLCTEHDSPNLSSLAKQSHLLLTSMPTERLVTAQVLTFEDERAPVLEIERNTSVIFLRGRALAQAGRWRDALHKCYCDLKWLDARINLARPMNLVEELQDLFALEPPAVVVETLQEIMAICKGLAPDPEGDVHVPHVVLQHVRPLTDALSTLRALAAESVGAAPGSLWPIAPVELMPEQLSPMVYHAKEWHAWWAGYAQPNVTTSGTAPSLVATWLQAGRREVVRIFDAKSGMRVGQFDLDPIPKPPHMREEDDDEDAAFGVVGLALGGTMQLAVAWSNGTIRFYSVPNGEEVMALDFEIPVVEMAMSADGSTLTASDGETVGIWNLTSGEQVLETKDYPDVSALAVSADGAVVAVGRGAGLVTLLNARSGKKLQERKVPSLPDILALAISADGQKIVASSTASVVVVTDRQGTELHSHRHPGQIDAVAINNEGTHVGSVSGGDETDQRARVFELSSGRRLVFQGHTGDINAIQFCAPLGQPALLTSGHDGTIRVWDLDGRPSAHNPAHEDGVDLLSSGADCVLSASATWPEIKFWNADGRCIVTNHLDEKLTTTASEGITRGGVMMGRKDDFALAAATHGRVCSYAGPPLFQELQHDTLAGAAFFSHLAVSGQPLVAAATTEGLVLLQPDTLKQVRKVPLNFAGQVVAVASLPTDKFVTVATEGKMVTFDMESGQVLSAYDRDVRGDTVVALDMILRSGAPWIVSYSEGSDSVILRNALRTEDEVGLDGEHTTSVACSRDGRLAVVGSAQGGFVAWDLEAGADAGSQPNAHDGAIDCMCLTEDSSILVTASDDGCVKAWSVSNGYQLLSTQAFNSPVTCLTILNGAATVVAGLRAGQLAFLRLSPAPAVGEGKWGAEDALATGARVRLPTLPAAAAPSMRKKRSSSELPPAGKAKDKSERRDSSSAAASKKKSITDPGAPSQPRSSAEEPVSESAPEGTGSDSSKEAAPGGKGCCLIM